MRMLGIAAMLASCSQSDNGLLPADGSGDTVQVAFLASAPQQAQRAIEGTDDEKALTRYICAVYHENGDGTLNTDDRVTQVEQATGQFVLTLEKDKDYIFLLWADKGTPQGNDNYYSTASLQSVSINSGHETEPGQIAYYAREEVHITSGGEIGTITLKHAVAKVAYHNASAFVEGGNTLSVTYRNGAVVPSFNVADGKGTVSSTLTNSHKFTSIGAVDGVIATDYIFASPEEAQVGEVVLQLNDEPEITLSNVPFRQNYQTTIKGNFSNYYESEFTVNNSIEDWEGDKEDTLD